MKRRSIKRRKQYTMRAEKAIQLAAGSPEMHIEFAFLDKGKEVTSIRFYGMATTGYPMCPSCGFGVEREYQNYCEVCGQRLLWNRFAKGQVTLRRLMSLK